MHGLPKGKGTKITKSMSIKSG